MINSKNGKKTLYVVLCTLMMIGVSGCVETNIFDGEDQTEKNTLVIALGTDRFNGFYPWIDFLNDQTMIINSNIFNCLVEFDETFRIIPGLAESWNNPNTRTWRLNLRNNVKFHNNDNFTAQDVKYSIELIQEDTNNTLYNFLPMLQDIKIIDDFTVDIITFEPYPTLLNKIAYIYIVSKKYHEDPTNTLPIGTGAYKFTRYVEKTHIILDRFEGYWKKAPIFKNVTFNFLDEYNERLTALINGQCDIIDFIMPDSVEELSKIEGVKTHTFLHQVVTYLGFNFRENDSCCFKGEKNPFSDVRVRKAIYHAINISEIIGDVFHDYAEPASQFVTPHISGYNSEIQRLSYNVEKAGQYMKDAGYEHGFNVTLDTTTLSAGRVTVAEIIKDQLSKIQINATLNISSSSDFYTKIMSGNSSLYIVGWRADSGDAGEIFDNLLRSVDKDSGFGTANYGNYSHPEIDRIAENIFYNMNLTERLILMQEGFTIAMEDVACVPLYIYEGISAMIDELSWDPRADGLIKIEDIDYG
jgi:peptide/nickel transport system substrate-binding protein